MHLGIIMDGNGRWAQNKGRPRLFGHQAGARRVREIVESCPDLGIKYLTIFIYLLQGADKGSLQDLNME